MRRVADHNGVRLGQFLQPGGEVRRLADHRRVVGHVRAQQLADQHDARGDADAHPERFRHLAGSVDAERQFQPCADGTLRIILAGKGISEVGENTVALIAGDPASRRLDERGRMGLIDHEHITQILGVEARGKCGRPDEVAEHYCHEPALCRQSGRRTRKCRGHESTKQSVTQVTDTSNVGGAEKGMCCDRLVVRALRAARNVSSFKGMGARQPLQPGNVADKAVAGPFHRIGIVQKRQRGIDLLPAGADQQRQFALRHPEVER